LLYEAIIYNQCWFEPPYGIANSAALSNAGTKQITPYLKDKAGFTISSSLRYAST
jgi:hypothetical protein